jgi:UDP-galactopyranose mutase
LKQWEADPTTLSSDIIARLPVRYHHKTDYFDDTWQGIPLDGYQRTFAKMLNHSKIDVYRDTDFYAIRHLVPESCRIVFCGPIDRFFEYQFGKLGWRTLRFEKEVHRVKDFQGTSVMNFADIDVPYTRTHEFRYFHDERDYPDDKTVIFREYSTGVGAESNPFYPVNSGKDLEKLEMYEREAKRHPNLIFCGRQGRYRYLDMDEAIDDALVVYKESGGLWPNG